MKLKELAGKPQLVMLTLDDKEIVEKYGEAVTFNVLDKLPISIYTKLATIKSDDVEEMFNVLRDLILDEDGNPIMSDEVALPIDIMTAAVLKVSDNLGKSQNSQT